MGSFRKRDPLASAPAARCDALMGTVVTQRVYGLAGATCTERVYDEILRLQKLWSVFSPGSELSELARRAGHEALHVDADTAWLLSEARELHALTGGAFDVTIGPALTLWRAAARSGKAPSPEQIQAARALIDGRQLELDAERVRLPRAGQSLDFGAIGKGFAADSGCAIYRRHGIRHAFLDLGGNVAVVGKRPDGAPWRVGIQAPNEPRGVVFGYLEVSDTSVVTSGSYERGFECGGTRYSHIIDPRSAYPIADRSLSVTVVCPSSMRADALSTALMVMGAEEALRFALAHDIDALIRSERYGICITPGMREVFQAR